MTTVDRPGDAPASPSAAAEVIETASRVRRCGLTVSSLGNVSVREGGHVWITPTRVPASSLRADSISVLSLDGEPVAGPTPSRETSMHLELYRRNPMAGAVVHTHSPWATAWSHLGIALPPDTEEMRYHGLSGVPCSRYGPVGTEELAEAAADALSESPVALLRRHGVVAMAPSSTEAYELCALAEQQAHVQWLLRLDAGGERGARGSRSRSCDSRE